ncbi:MAG: 23S rRNA (adenine(2503)-C(2))-methyltransferase RlmN [Clostridia bacterium]
MESIIAYTHNELKDLFVKYGLKRYRAIQVLDWIYNKKVYDFALMSNISKEDQELLKKAFTLDLPEIVTKLVSKDGTVKYLFRFEDGSMVESVLMDYDYGTSICISSQSGCKMGCSFCASSKVSFNRSLKGYEMTGQILKASLDSNKIIARCVVMGIGEPFDNYENLLNFLRVINMKEGFNLGGRRITVSTCGIVPKIYEFADLGLQVNLSVSLHEVTDEARSRIMPINKKYPIAELIEACEYYFKTTNRRVSFEYALIPGQNDSFEHARKLCDLLKGVMCYVNVIPVNPIEGALGKEENSHNMSVFCAILKEKGVPVTIRRELGRDINAACGQLRRKYDI